VAACALILEFIFVQNRIDFIVLRVWLARSTNHSNAKGKIPSPSERTYLTFRLSAAELLSSAPQPK
jgi:hypothetical protein